MAAEKDIIVALELATTSIRAIAGQRMPDGTMQILAFAEENASNVENDLLLTKKLKPNLLS